MDNGYFFKYPYSVRYLENQIWYWYPVEQVRYRLSKQPKYPISLLTISIWYGIS
jgi:hypothetical protein